MNMRSYFRCAVICAIASLLVAIESRAGAQPLDGEYTFRVTTPSGAVVATGRFVIAPAPFDLAGIPLSIVEPANQRSRWLVRLGSTQPLSPNTCFGFERSSAYVDGREFYGGITASGLSVYRARGDSV